jgi:predicted amino acid dehydrogenase
MKRVICISLGSSKYDYEFNTEFLGQDFHVKRIGTDGDLRKAEALLVKWDRAADAFGIGSVKFPYTIGPKRLTEERTRQIENISKRIKTPVTTGANLRKVTFEWSIHHIQYNLNGFFTNARILVLSGMANYNLAKIISEYTDNITFADPILEHGIPKFLNSIKELELYANGVHEVLKYAPGKRLATSTMPIKTWNEYILRKAMQKNTMIMVPYHEFDEYLKVAGLEELGKKIVITSTVYDARVDFLRKRGVDMIIDNTPRILERVVGVNVLEAMIIAALGKPSAKITDDEFMEIISDQHLEPKIIYPQGEPRRINRFAFVIHPLSQNDFKKEKAVGMFTKIPGFVDTLEKVMAYSPPFIYSKITGVKSPTGMEAEGWLISVGGTPKQMLAHSPEFTYKRLLQAARMAKRLGAQIMGLGAFTKVVGDAGVTVSRQAEIPITTGNSYSASGALWAAADAVRRMGLIKVEKGKLLDAKAMVMGATGSIGAVCSRLLALVVNDLYLVGRQTAKLLALKKSIQDEHPGCKITLSTYADRYLKDMDIIVTTTSGAGKKILDITKVKPGCVITDVARPLDLSPEDVAKRPDVLVIESGEIELPGKVKMKNIGLPQGVAYACLAETIVLALEGRFEVFTVGRDIEWEKVKEIYRLGLKHGMKLAAISGHKGVYTDEDIQRVKELALESRGEKISKKEEKSRPDAGLRAAAAVKERKKADVKTKAVKKPAASSKASGKPKANFKDKKARASKEH